MDNGCDDDNNNNNNNNGMMMVVAVEAAVIPWTEVEDIIRWRISMSR
jgi:hypothetical protein